MGNEDADELPTVNVTGPQELMRLSDLNNSSVAELSISMEIQTDA